MGEIDLAIASLLGALLTGSVGGAIFTAVATDRRGARDLALKLLEKYVEKFDEIATLEENLNDQAKLNTIAGRDEVAKTVNWLEFVSACYMSGNADADVLRSVDFHLIIRRLQAQLITAQKAPGSLAFPDANESWPNMKRIADAAVPG